MHDQLSIPAMSDDRANVLWTDGNEGNSRIPHARGDRHTRLKVGGRVLDQKQAGLLKRTQRGRNRGQ
jgi:hypothetical protein